MFTAGQNCIEWSKVQKEVLKDALLKALNAIFNQDWPTKEIRHFEVHHWKGENAPILPSLGHIQQFYASLTSDDRFFFAGSYGGASNMFELGGAIDAGEKAAIEVIKSLD